MYVAEPISRLVFLYIGRSQILLNGFATAGPPSYPALWSMSKGVAIS